MVSDSGLKLVRGFWPSSMELSLNERIGDRMSDLVSMVDRSSSEMNSSPFSDMGREGDTERDFSRPSVFSYSSRSGQRRGRFAFCSNIQWSKLVWLRF